MSGLVVLGAGNMLLLLQRHGTEQQSSTHIRYKEWRCQQHSIDRICHKFVDDWRPLPAGGDGVSVFESVNNV